jgi:hypothetical protein
MRARAGQVGEKKLQFFPARWFSHDGPPAAARGKSLLDNPLRAFGERVVAAWRQHFQTQRRSVGREQPLPDRSSMLLASRLAPPRRRARASGNSSASGVHSEPTFEARPRDPATAGRRGAVERASRHPTGDQPGRGPETVHPGPAARPHDAEDASPGRDARPEAVAAFPERGPRGRHAGTPAHRRHVFGRQRSRRTAANPSLIGDQLVEFLLATAASRHFPSVFLSVHSRFPIQGQPLPESPPSATWAASLKRHQFVIGSRDELTTNPGGTARHSSWGLG